MRTITDFVRATALPEAGPALSSAQVEQLSFSSYYYFRYLLVIDHVLDAPAPGAHVPAPQLATVRLLTYTDLFERSVRGLAGLFPAGDPFWGQLDACKKEYAGSNQYEKQLNTRRGPFSLEAFERLAAGKSAVCNAIVYALARLGGTTEPVEALLECLRHTHIALQCVDDVEDFRADWEQGQYTYAHALVEAYLDGQGLDARALAVQLVQNYLYISGTADALYAKAQRHYVRAIGVAKAFGLTPLEKLLVQLVIRCGKYRADITKNVERARQRAAGQAASPERSEPVAA